MSSSPAQPGPRYGSGPRQYQPPADPTPVPEPTPAPEEPSYGPPDPKYPESTGKPGTPEPDHPSSPPKPDYPEPPPKPDYPAPPPKRCPPSMECDTDGIDDIRCEAQAVKAEADELALADEDLQKRQTAFEETRAKYDVARVAAEAAAEKQKEVIAELLCQIHLNTDAVDRLDNAFGQVIACIAECREETGCGIPDDCGFGGDWTSERIDDLRAKVTKIEKYFDDVLIKEPTALDDRVKAVQKLIDDLTAAMKAEMIKDPKRWYAQAKEAEWARLRITGRFADQNEFQECLCRGLTCSLQGRRLIAKLVGDRKYQECREEARRKRCDWLRKNIVSETLATAKLLEKQAAT